MSSFHKYHVGNFDTWLSLEERNLKPVIYLSEHKSVSLTQEKCKKTPKGD